jgi:hypothetical protein
VNVTLGENGLCENSGEPRVQARALYRGPHRVLNPLPYPGDRCDASSLPLAAFARCSKPPGCLNDDALSQLDHLAHEV